MMSGVNPSRLGASTLAPAAMSRLALSRSSRYTAQCSAVAPSICGALTSAFCWISVRSAAVSPFMTASATSLLLAAAIAFAPTTATASATRTRVIETSPRVPASQLRQPVGAVALRLPLNAVHVEDAQQQVPGRHRLALVGEVPVPCELSVGAADDHL